MLKWLQCKGFVQDAGNQMIVHAQTIVITWASASAWEMWIACSRCRTDISILCLKHCLSVVVVVVVGCCWHCCFRCNFHPNSLSPYLRPPRPVRLAGCEAQLDRQKAFILFKGKWMCMYSHSHRRHRRRRRRRHLAHRERARTNMRALGLCKLCVNIEQFVM